MPVVQTFISLGGKACLDPKALADSALKQGLDISHWFGLPNSFYSARGKNPGYAYVLMTKKDLDGLILTYQQIMEFSWRSSSPEPPDGEPPPEPVEPNRMKIQNLRFVRATALYADGILPSDTTPYLVLLMDVRGDQTLSSIDEQYNVRCPTHPTDSDPYYGESLNSTLKWTWQEMLDDIWDNLPTTDTSPTIVPPVSGGETEWEEEPESFRFLGMSAWEAYNISISTILQDVWYDPRTQTWALIDLTVEDEDWENLKLHPHPLLEYNAPIVENGFIPATLRVFFPRIDDEFGSEIDAYSNDSNNWAMNASTYKDVAISGGIADTILPVWDNHPARYDFDNLLENSAELTTRSEEIANNLFERLGRKDGFYHVRVGIHENVFPNSQVYAIRWGDFGDAYGMTTELFGENATFVDSIHYCSGNLNQTTLLNDPPRTIKRLTTFSETINAPNLARKTFPVYPRQLQLVKNVDYNITSAQDWCLEGKICRLSSNGESYNDGVDCWIRPIDNPTSAFPTDLSTNFYFFGKQAGRLTATGAGGSVNLPVYLVELRPC